MKIFCPTGLIRKLSNYKLAKQILVKVQNFELLRPLRSFIKKPTKSVPLVEFVDGFDFTLERQD